MTTVQDTPATEHGTVTYIPLNRLKKSPRNARKTPHRTEDIGALAASIGARTMLQSPVVEPEVREDGAPTGAAAENKAMRRSALSHGFRSRGIRWLKAVTWRTTT